MEKDKLRKIARLAQLGEGGEREAARYVLEQQGTTAEAVLSDTSQDEVFVTIGFKNLQERRIIIQNYCRLFNVNEISYWKGSRNITVCIPTDKATEFKESCEALKTHWRRELSVFLDAFIQKNCLFSDLPHTGPSGLSMEEIEEIVSMARAMKQLHLGKLLEA